MTYHRIGVLQSGIDIDKTQHLNFKRFIVHAPVEELADPVFSPENRAGFSLHQIVEAIPRFANSALGI